MNSAYRTRRDYENRAAASASRDPLPVDFARNPAYFHVSSSRGDDDHDMRIQTVLDVFHEAVPRAFRYLADDHGFVMTRNDDYAFTARAPHCDVVVELDWGSIVVSIRPTATGRPVRLSFIVGAKDPTILFLPRYPWGPDDARDEVERQADLLDRFCGELLAGDFSRWAALEAHQQHVLEQWRRESERLVKEARVKLVRRRAEAAWSRRSFSEAAQLYGSIREDLSQAEIARHEYCRRRTILVAVPREKQAVGHA